jgi:hypothetical protein
MRPSLGYRSNLSPVNKLQLYMAFIRPVTCYGWEPRVYTHKSKIQKLQTLKDDWKIAQNNKC